MITLKHISSIFTISSLFAASPANGQSNPLIGGNTNCDTTAAEEQGYWYSPYNMSTLAMSSGMEDTFMPDIAVIQQKIQLTDADPGDGDTTTPPLNADMLIEALAARRPADTKTLSLAAQGLIWYAAGPINTTSRSQAVVCIIQTRDALVSANQDNTTRQALAIRGLREACRTSGSEPFITSAANVFITWPPNMIHCMAHSAARATITQTTLPTFWAR